MCEVSSFDRDNTSGFLHQPASGGRGAVALTHGAGGNCNAGLLIAVADAFCAHGWTVLRYNLPFRRKRPFGPPLPRSAALDQAGIREAVTQIRGLTGGPVIAAGHSYGGRQTTMAAAQEPKFCDAILALSYPLHPPNKPDQLRTAHFPELHVPVLFVHGGADPFGSAAEMQDAIRTIPSQTKLVIVERAGHDLKNGKIDIDAVIVKELEALLSRQCFSL
jgi:hypothetical protein